MGTKSYWNKMPIAPRRRWRNGVSTVTQFLFESDHQRLSSLSLKRLKNILKSYKFTKVYTFQDNVFFLPFVKGNGGRRDRTSESQKSRGEQLLSETQFTSIKQVSIHILNSSILQFFVCVLLRNSYMRFVYQLSH